MGEFEEFAEALFGQLTVELDEEKEITNLAIKANEDLGDRAQFKALEDISQEVFSEFKEKTEQFLGVGIPTNLTIKYLELEELKKLKGEKVFADNDAKKFVTELFGAVAKEDHKKITELMQEDMAKYLVYSTYAKFENL